jgi:hypothetical protein
MNNDLMTLLYRVYQNDNTDERLFILIKVRKEPHAAHEGFIQKNKAVIVDGIVFALMKDR